MELIPCCCPHHYDGGFHHIGDCCQTCPFCGEERVRLDDIQTHVNNCPQKIEVDREKIFRLGLFSD